jgi:hypothetical protein
MTVEKEVSQAVKKAGRDLHVEGLLKILHDLIIFW